jgi:hypothetical protein
LKNPIAFQTDCSENPPMIAQLEIRQMPLPQKLALLEAVWTEIAAEPDTVEIPEWHREILDERQQSLDQGSSQILDWELAKEQINRMVR